MGRQDHVVFVGEGSDEAVPAFLGLGREHVHRGSGKVSGIKMPLQCIQIGDESTGEIDEDGILLHVGELVLAEEPHIGLPPVDVQRHGVGLLQQRVEGGHPLCVAHGELLLEIVEHDMHAHGLGQHGQLRADVPVADDPEGFAANLMRTLGAFVPKAVLEMMGVRRNPTHKADDVADDQLDNRARVGIRGIEHGYALLAGVLQIDLVGSDAEASHCG